MYKNICFAFALSFIFSFLDLGLVACWFIRPRRLKKRNDYSYNKNTGRHLMVFSAILLCAVFSLRFAIGEYSHVVSTEVIPEMPGYEQFFNSLLHAFQTFSMDEEYLPYSEQGKELVKFLFNSKIAAETMSKIESAFTIYNAALNLAAPIVGGAFIFEVLAGIFPQLLFLFSKYCFWKQRFFFTALNEESVALAKSVVSDPNIKHFQIIFTDAYADNENEESTELLLNAKALGAICLKDDLLHILLKRRIPFFNIKCKDKDDPENKKPPKKNDCSTSIFLSDRSENINLQTLSLLLEPDRQKKLKDTQIFVFGSDAKMTYVEDEVTYICNRFRAEYGSDSIVPQVIPVNGIRNMAQNLFYDLPLFECLYGKSSDNREINLTIIGSGVIGTELFLNAYWFGQIPDVKLNINIVSKDESEKAFRSRINNINPEILLTEAKEKDDKILNASVNKSKPDFQPPYFKLRFKKADALTSDLEDLLVKGIGEKGEKKFPLRDSDFFIVAVGSDEDNYSIAEKIKLVVGNYHLHCAKSNKTIISYVIYNSSLQKALNRCPRIRTVNGKNPDEFDIYMHAFGSIDEMFSCENIFFDRVNEIGERIGKSYIGDERPERTYNYYNERANRSRALHVNYKAFCLGAIQPSLFNSKSDQDYKKTQEKTQTDFPEFVKKFQRKEQNLSETSDGEDGSNSVTLHELAWMEHRRWNAFMRINGFRCPDNYTDYEALDCDAHKKGVDKEYQFLFLKLHPCIVEGTKGAFVCQLGLDSETGCLVRMKPDYDSMVVGDKLDRISQQTRQPFKKYDYPEEEIRSK